MTIKLENFIMPEMVDILLNSKTIQVDNWITDGSILLNCEKVNVKTVDKLNPINDIEPIRDFIEKETNIKKLKKVVLKKKNEVEMSQYSYLNLFLMYNKNIKELMHDSYAIQLDIPFLKFYYYDDSFYIFVDVSDYFTDDENEHVEFIGILKKCEAKHPNIALHLYWLEKKFARKVFDKLKIKD